jgi:hypothetical protein
MAPARACGPETVQDTGVPRLHLLIPFLLAAACGGSTAPLSPPAPPASPPGSLPVAGAPPSDAAQARREAFANPGGMWMPRQMAGAAVLAELGLTIPAATLSDLTAAPLSAVVSLGGCTGSFVSAQGLVVTNHHCVQGALQLNSTPDDNLVERGFLARTRADEKPAGATQRIQVAQQVTDVTARITDGLAAIADPQARALAVEAREKALVAECERGRPAIKCKLSSFFSAHEWQLIEYLEIRDVRLVYVPHRAVGNYGGEIDNWAWPRHTGDFSFLRAYVGKDGQPADPSPDNVPYQPKAHLAVGTGVAAGDLVFVAGYPGRTSRLQTSAELRRATTWTYPRYIEKGNQRMALLEELGKLPGETAIKAGVVRQSVQNGLEKFGGIQATLQSSDLIQRKEADEQAFRAWAAAAPERKRFLDALDRHSAQLEAVWAVENQEEAWKDASSGSTLLSQAIFLVRWVHERQKPDAERKPGFQDRDRSLVEAGHRTFAKRFDAPIDRAMWKLMLTRAAAEPASAAWLRSMLGLGRGARLDERTFDRALDGFYRMPRGYSASAHLRMRICEGHFQR